MSAYSKYITAAIEKSPVVAQTVAARDPARDIPPVFRDRFIHSDGLPVVAGTHAELCAALAERHYAEDLRIQAGIHGTELWAAQRIEGPSDATDAALCRFDAIAERQARYRAATFLHPRHPGKREASKIVSKAIRRSLYARIDALSALRGEDFTDTLGLIIEAGAILLDERAKRHELSMITQLYAAAKAGRQLEAERYIDPASPTLERAYDMVADPMKGAPESIAALVSSFPRAS